MSSSTLTVRKGGDGSEESCIEKGAVRVQTVNVLQSTPFFQSYATK